MKRSRPFAIVLVMGLLLAALAVGAGLAQAPNADSEPDVPLYSTDNERSGESSQLPASDDPGPSASDPPGRTEAQRLRSGPVQPDGAVAAPEQLPEGIDATTAIADFRVAGSVLRPRASDVDWDWDSGGGCIYATAGNNWTIFNTGLYLPQGSNVLAVRMYYDDTSSSDSVGWFSVYNLYGELVDEWFVTSLGDTGNGFNDTEMISHTIDYLSYSYTLLWRPTDLGSDTQLCGFRVFYEPPAHIGAFLPAISRETP